MVDQTRSPRRTDVQRGRQARPDPMRYEVVIVAEMSSGLGPVTVTVTTLPLSAVPVMVTVVAPPVVETASAKQP